MFNLLIFTLVQTNFGEYLTNSSFNQKAISSENVDRRCCFLSGMSVRQLFMLPVIKYYYYYSYYISNYLIKQFNIVNAVAQY